METLACLADNGSGLGGAFPPLFRGWILMFFVSKYIYIYIHVYFLVSMPPFSFS